ncbi:SRPBCC family protein [Catellatospora bangladeshensis]|uniref:Activator of HSP90 ATPase n=2 Tax=Catellatospora bangladeshensis TaxID=310355 RepID=A0A8J3NJ11_9ACTN|nr:SRPBCC domain-containing protein [Catellatospora bangladeshensis]GIF82990.1 activator of HSP90 ATPase [Catellatospora bangladeshensis]
MTTHTGTLRTFTVVRRLEAPPETVYRAWTEPDQLTGWFANPTAPPSTLPTTIDLRVGGQWRLHMIENEQKAYVTGGVFREIVPGRRLVFAWGAVDGWPALDPARLEDSPLVTLDFVADAGVTEMSLRVDFPEHFTDEDVKGWLDLGILHGWSFTLDRLAPYLAQPR